MSSWQQIARGVAVAALLIVPSVALAQPDKAEAERLFDEGRKLMMERGKLDQACETFVRSLELMVRGDTLLNLAECHRRQGKTATAWRELGEALGHAETVRFKEAIEVAEQIRRELEAKLSRLTVNVPAPTEQLPGFSIQLNGAEFPKQKWGQPMALDPASYTVEATAAGHQPFSVAIELGAEADQQQITVQLEPVPAPSPPPSEPKPAPPPPPAPQPPPESGGIHPVAITGFVIGGAGLLTWAIAGGIGASWRGDFDDRCPNDVCPPGSEDDIDEAIIVSHVATVGLVVGLVGVGVGVTGLFLDTGQATEVSAVSLRFGPGRAMLRGRF